MKVEIVKFQDGDFGDCLRVEVNGEKLFNTFIVANEKNSEVLLLKATLAEIFFENNDLKEQVKEAREFKSTFQKLLKLAGGYARYQDGKLRV